MNIAKDFFNPDLTGNPTKVAQGLDFTTGGEVALLKPRDGINWPSHDLNGTAKLGTSWVFGFGATTPFANDKPVTFALINSSVITAFPQLAHVPTGITNVGFVTPDRSRFFWKYYSGARFKTWIFSRNAMATCDAKKRAKSEDTGAGQSQKPAQSLVPKTPTTASCEAPLDKFPGTVDITFGQDASVTGGMLRHVVFRLDAVYPFPAVPGMHVLGSVNMALTKNKLSPPISIQSPSPSPVESGAGINTVRVLVPPLDRDIFRIGVGVDLEQILQALNKKNQPSAAADVKTSGAATNSSSSGTSGK